MLKRILVAVVAIVIAAGCGIYLLARSVFGQDAVRTAFAAQLSSALGQPVSIAQIGVSVYPRVTVNLSGVTVGDPVRAEIETLNVGTALGALFSRRIENASLLLDTARIELPLPLPGLATEAGDSDGTSPVELVSIDEIALRNVEIVSGGRTLRGEIEIGPRDQGFDIRRMTLTADDMSLEATGVISDPSGPTGELTVNAGALNFDELLAFIADFQGGSGLGASAQTPVPAPAPAAAEGGMNIAVALAADRATLGDLTLDSLSGTARIVPGEVTLEPISFNVFDGHYDGALALSLDETPTFHLTADLAGIDVASATAFAGAPDTISGRLSGRIDLTGEGMEAGAVGRTTRGTVRVDIADGIVKRLGLVRAVVIATAMRANTNATAAIGETDEPFSRLGTTLTVENGVARTNDLLFESDDLSLTAQGAIELDGDPVTLTGRIQLSEQLTKEGGTDLARYTQEQGRVTVPVAITGSADGLSVRIGVGEMMQRALRNRATEEAERAIQRGLGGLFR